MNDSEIARLVQWLRVKEAHSEALAALREHTDAASRDLFLRTVFDFWLEAGARGPERWAFSAMSAGGDSCAAATGAACRRFAKKCDRLRANQALDRLKDIGTRVAMMEISRTVDETTRDSVRRYALDVLEVLAQQNNWTLDALEDYIVPECGLDSGGIRVFDFGPRQFRMVFARTIFGEAFRLRLTDANGTFRDALPKPAKTDDPLMAASAKAEWKTLNRMLPGVLRHQSRRLELAMGAQRRWPLAEFQERILDHPVLFQIARRVIWTHLNDPDVSRTQFRVCEDKTFATAEERSMAPSDGFVSVSHPLLIPQSERLLWNGVLNDYGLIQPFDQINRLTFAFQQDQLSGMDVPGVTGSTVAALSFGLEQLGWRLTADSEWMSKTWPAAGVTALTMLEPGDLRKTGKINTGPQTILKLFFISGGRGPADLSIDELVPTTPENAGAITMASVEDGMSSVPAWSPFPNNPVLPLNQVLPTILSDTVRDFEVIRLRRLANPPA